MPDPLHHEMNIHLYLRDQLLKQFPEETEETLADTLEGMTDLREKLARVVQSYLDDTAMVAALNQRMDDMKVRRDRIRNRYEKKRVLVTEVMERAGIKRLADPEFTASLRAAPAPVIIQWEEAIPRDYWKNPPSVLDRARLRKALEAKIDIPGAVLGNPPMTLNVRTK